MLEGTMGAYLAYASSAWTHCLTLKKNAKQIDWIHHLMLLCYGRLYRTVSYLPCTVICGWLPEKYRITKRAILFSKNKDIVLPSGKSILAKEEGSSLEKLERDFQNQIMQKWPEEWQRQMNKAPNSSGVCRRAYSILLTLTGPEWTRGVCWILVSI